MFALSWLWHSQLIKTSQSLQNQTSIEFSYWSDKYLNKAEGVNEKNEWEKEQDYFYGWQ